MWFVRNCFIPSLLFGILIASAINPGLAGERSFTLSGSVSAGDTYNARLKGLPEAGSLSVVARGDGPLSYFVVGPSDTSGGPASRSRLFSVADVSKTSFSIKIPAAGTYFLVVDNTKGQAERSFILIIRAATAESAEDRSARMVQVDEQLARFETQLREAFRDVDLAFAVRRCEGAAAASPTNEVVICEEIGPLLIDRLQDQAAAQSGMVFVLFRKVGARLLRQWKHPDHANPGAIDEFATALSVMFGQQARLVQLLSALQPDGASAEMVLDLEPDRLEFLTAERADSQLMGGCHI